MNTKHTPGQWEAMGAIVRSEYQGEGGFLIADCSQSPFDERSANARLIAAAPELLEALKAQAEYLDGVAEKLAGDPEDLLRNMKKYGAAKWVNQFGTGAAYRAEEARAAIALAEGVQG